MILHQNSYFRKPPKVLLPEQVVIFNAIRYSLDICDISFERLKKNLFTFVYSKENLKPSFPLLYLDVWTIFQNLSIFLKIIKSHFNIPLSDPLFDTLREVIHLRDTSQHINERITQILAKIDLPIYGILSWYAQQDINSGEGIITTLYSGTVTDKKKVKSNPVNPSGKPSKDLINQVEFTGIIKPNRREDYCEEKTVTINNLIDKTKEIIVYFEKQIRDQTKSYDLTDRHNSDLIIQLFVKKF
jgi:hypothetical protein